MKSSIGRSALLACASALAFSTAHAQAGLGVEPRWAAFLGCWAADSTGNRGRVVSPNVTCFVPVSGTRAVEVLTIARDKVVGRDRIDATGVPHALDAQGCAGSETVNWSSTERRLFFSTSYNCTTKTQGSSTTIYSFLPGGALLRVEVVRSGGGTVEMYDRLRPVAIPGAVLSSVASMIETHQRAITTARANAAAPITIDEVVEATHVSDAEAVRLWLTSSDQIFTLNNGEITRLTQSGLPGPIIRAVMNSTGGPVNAPTIFNENVYRGTMYATQPVIVQYVPQEYAPQGPIQPVPSYAQQLPPADPIPGTENTIAPCPPPGFYPTNPYSAYNSQGFCPNGFSQYSPYGSIAPYYPYGSYAPIVTSSPRIIGRNGVGGNIRNHVNAPIRAIPRTSQPTGRRPVGRRP